MSHAHEMGCMHAVAETLTGGGRGFKAVGGEDLEERE